jgi:hypothetical protein
MAGITQTYVLTIKDDAQRVVSTETHGVTGDAEEEFNVVAPQAGDVTVPLTIAVSGIVAFWIVSDKNVTLTENDDGTPDLTKALVANVPFWWYTGLGTNPFTVDITALKFANAGATEATVKGGFLSS